MIHEFIRPLEKLMMSDVFFNLEKLGIEVLCVGLDYCSTPFVSPGVKSSRYLTFEYHADRNAVLKVKSIIFKEHYHRLVFEDESIIHLYHDGRCPLLRMPHVRSVEVNRVLFENMLQTYAKQTGS